MYFLWNRSECNKSWKEIRNKPFDVFYRWFSTLYLPWLPLPRVEALWPTEFPAQSFRSCTSSGYLDGRNVYVCTGGFYCSEGIAGPRGIVKLCKYKYRNQYFEVRFCRCLQHQSRIIFVCRLHKRSLGSSKAKTTYHLWFETSTEREINVVTSKNVKTALE